MKKQFHKIKIAAENFSRSNKTENKNNDDSLQRVEQQVEKYKDILEKITKKFTTNAISSSSSANQNHEDIRDKRIKKVNEYRIGIAMDESQKDLRTGPLKEILDNCAKLEKTIAMEIVNNEINVENDVTKKLTTIMDTHIPTIQKQKRIVNKLMQDNESARHKHQTSIRLNENQTKINLLKEEQEEFETKLEKERDILAAEMFDLIIEEENIANYVAHFIKLQELYYRSALKEIEDVILTVNESIKKHNWRVFKIPLEEHLVNTNRTISYVIELCVCYLLERGINEEGLLRIGCAGSKLRRMKSAIDAKIFVDILPIEYQDVHVVAGVLKSYLRDLPEPLLTYKLYNNFIDAAIKTTESQRKSSLLNTINQLPKEHYFNLRYLTKFLTILSKNQQINKMSTQNIAIVMSPNLLWQPNQNDTDYAQKVSSTAAVNTIVELLISDWNFFFDGDVKFYYHLTKEKLFQEINNGVNNDNKEITMIPSPQQQQQQHSSISYIPQTTASGVTTIITSTTTTMTASTIASGNSGNGGGVSNTGFEGMSKSMIVGNINHHHNNNNNNYNTSNNMSHSRSSSHDTSLILLTETMKRSQSNSSLSDQSSPNQGSPKLPIRRKHNKQAAPTPPDLQQHHQQQQHLNRDNTTNVQKSIVTTGTKLEDKFEDVCITTRPPDRPPQPLKLSDSIENLNKPDKPPRPIITNETQTLNRHAYKIQKGGGGNGGGGHDYPLIKPKAMPRSAINVAIKNLEGTDLLDEPSILMRDKTFDDKGIQSYTFEKPAIPERPASLIRPPNYKGQIHELLHGSANELNQTSSIDMISSTNSALKKTQSFRTSQGKINNISNNNNNNNNGGTATTLERTHIYNVDKQQVAIIDVSENTNLNKTNLKLNSLSQPDLLNDDDVGLESLPIDNTFTQVPPSPRGFDPKVKRPQVPAPPPPNRPKSSDNSTNL